MRKSNFEQSSNLNIKIMDNEKKLNLEEYLEQMPTVEQQLKELIEEAEIKEETRELIRELIRRIIEILIEEELLIIKNK